MGATRCVELLPLVSGVEGGRVHAHWWVGSLVAAPLFTKVEEEVTIAIRRCYIVYMCKDTSGTTPSNTQHALSHIIIYETVQIC